MPRMADLSVAKRLSLLVGAALLALAFTIVGSVTVAAMITGHVSELQAMERTNAALNHLDTRESELKSDVYRHLLGEDMQGDTAEDLTSVREAVADVEAVLPAELTADFTAVTGAVESFSTYVSGIVSRPAGSTSATSSGRTGSGASRAPPRVGACTAART